MGERVDVDDLIDAHGVAHILGLSQPNSVAGYLKRYADMPRPVIDLGRGRPRLWLRPDVERWAAERKRRSSRSSGGPTSGDRVQDDRAPD